MAELDKEYHNWQMFAYEIFSLLKIFISIAEPTDKMNGNKCLEQKCLTLHFLFCDKCMAFKGKELGVTGYHVY